MQLDADNISNSGSVYNDDNDDNVDDSMVTKLYKWIRSQISWNNDSDDNQQDDIEQDSFVSMQRNSTEQREVIDLSSSSDKQELQTDKSSSNQPSLLSRIQQQTQAMQKEYSSGTYIKLALGVAGM